MEALSALGINGKMLIAQIINFLILLLLLNKLLYKPLLGLFDQRKEKIEKGLKDAEESKKALDAAEEEAERIKEKAYKEANEILVKAKSEASEEAKAILSQAHQQGEKIVKSAADEAISLKNSALKEAKSQISELISLSLNKIIHQKIDIETRNKLTQEAIKELG